MKAVAETSLTVLCASLFCLCVCVLPLAKELDPIEACSCGMCVLCAFSIVFIVISSAGGQWRRWRKHYSRCCVRVCVVCLCVLPVAKELDPIDACFCGMCVLCASSIVLIFISSAGGQWRWWRKHHDVVCVFVL